MVRKIDKIKIEHLCHVWNTTPEISSNPKRKKGLDPIPKKKQKGVSDHHSVQEL